MKKEIKTTIKHEEFTTTVFNWTEEKPQLPIELNSEIHVTDGTGKMTGIKSINVTCNTFECHHLCALCGECYAQLTSKLYGYNLIKWLDYNQRLLTKNILQDYQLPLFTSRDIVRFNSFGGLDNDIQLINYINTCKLSPNTIFTLWTKNLITLKAVFSRYEKPSNLKIICSSPCLNIEVSYNTLINKGYTFIDRVFTVFTYDYLIKHDEIKVNCGGLSCKNCMTCYSSKIEDKQAREILKKDAKKFYKYYIQKQGFKVTDNNLEKLHARYNFLSR